MVDVPGLTPSQTVGPFLHICLPWPDGSDVVPAGTPGAVIIGGRLLDGAGAPVGDAIVETWQADSNGAFAHPDDPRPSAEPLPAAFRGFGRSATDAEGRWQIRTVKPGRVPAPGGARQAPHLDVSVFARGLLDRVVTRIYFLDEDEANEADPVLSTLPADQRATLLAVPNAAGYGLDIRLQGAHETVFFTI